MLAAAFVAPGATAAPRILVVTTTMGYRHSSIETAEKVIAELGRSSGLYDVDFASVAPPEGPGANASETQQAVHRAEQTVRAGSSTPHSVTTSASGRCQSFSSTSSAASAGP